MDRFGIVFRASPVRSRRLLWLHQFAAVLAVHAHCLFQLREGLACSALHSLPECSPHSLRGALFLAAIRRHDCGRHADQQDGTCIAQGLRSDARATLGCLHGQVCRYWRDWRLRGSSALGIETQEFKVEEVETDDADSRDRGGIVHVCGLMAELRMLLLLTSHPHRVPVS